MVSRIGYTKEVVIESDLNKEYEPVCTCLLEFYFIIGLNTVFLGNYLCINSGNSLTNWIKSEGLYVKFVSELPEFIHT